jgi:Zn-dependent M28 family amino/carboxypeptidase
MKTIEQLLDEGQLAGVTIWISADRVQVNTRASDSDGWSVHYGDTPGATLRAALEFRSTMVDDDPKPARPSFL